MSFFKRYAKRQAKKATKELFNPAPKKKVRQVSQSEPSIASIYKEIEEVRRNNEKVDRQLAAAKKAEAEYKETKDADKLVAFWEKAMKDDWELRGATWPFKLTDAYYRAKRYDDAWRELNDLVLSPDTRKKARQWQIRILKKEKKDYSHIQDLLDKGL